MTASITIQPMFAEISDKMPSIGLLWIVGLIAAALVLAFFRYSRYSLLLALPLAAAWFAGTIREFFGDSFFNSAVSLEMGRAYLLQVVFTSALPFTAVLICGAVLLRSLKVVKSPATN